MDIFCPDYNLAIEINGIYYHSDDCVSKDYHLNKTIRCEELDIQLIHLWDTQIDAQPELVKSLLSNRFDMNRKLYARQCRISSISINEYKIFCNENHIQGFHPARVMLGLWHSDLLVAVMGFGHSRFDKKVEWELVRFCSARGLSVVGGASRLFKHFVSCFHPDSIISYCERSIFNGRIYPKLGFTFSHYSKPNYYYYKRGKLESRNKFQKHKLSKLLESYDSNLTEYENMINNGYKRVWDCGQYVWRWEE